MAVTTVKHFEKYIAKPTSEYPTSGSFWEKAKWVFKSTSFKNLLWSVALALCMLFITSILLQVCNYRRPLEKPLPDVIHETVPYINLINVVNVQMAIGIIALAAVCIFPLKMRQLQVIRRLLFSYTITMLIRDFTMPVTNLPDPTERCKNLERKPVSFSPKAIYLTMSRGMTCGDLIFSGHTVALAMPSIICGHFYDMIWLTIILLLNGIVGSFLIIVSHLHYTVDVLLSWIIYSMVFWIYNTISEHPETFSKSLPKILIQFFAHIEWCDPVLWEQLDTQDSGSDDSDKFENQELRSVETSEGKFARSKEDSCPTIGHNLIINTHDLLEV